MHKFGRAFLCTEWIVWSSDALELLVFDLVKMSSVSIVIKTIGLNHWASVKDFLGIHIFYTQLS